MALVIAVLLATGVVGAVNVHDKHGPLDAHAGGPSGGPGLFSAAPADAETTTSSTLSPTTTLPAPDSAADAGATTTQPSVSTTTPTAPPPPPPPSTPPTNARGCTAWVTDATRQPDQPETVQVSSHFPSRRATVSVQYPRSKSVYGTSTNEFGQAQVAFTVPPGEPPGPAAVSVAIASSETCQTSFTVI